MPEYARITTMGVDGTATATVQADSSTIAGIIWVRPGGEMVFEGTAGAAATAQQAAVETWRQGHEQGGEAIVGGRAPQVAATLTTALTGTNNDLVFTAKRGGANSNQITVRYVNPGVNNASLSVQSDGRDIVVNLATSGAGAITTTSAQIITAVQQNSTANDLVSVANAATNDGTGVVTALAKTNLTGGSGPG
jgi:hypothetical protein